MTRFCGALLVFLIPTTGQAQQYQPTSLSNRDGTTHADQQRRGLFTGIFGSRTCQPSQQAPPVINITNPAPQAVGPDPATMNMLGQILGGQNQMMYHLGRLSGQQAPQQPAPIIVNPPAPAPAPIVIPPFTPPVAQPAPVVPYQSPYVAPIPYQPQPLPIAYAPQPLPQQYAPQPLPQQYQPAPLPQGYSPAPLGHNYAPQIIVQPPSGNGGTPGPQQLPQGYAPAPQRSGPGGGGSAPGIDFHYYGPTTPPPYMPPAVGMDAKNGSKLPPAPQPQVYSRMPRPDREKVAR